MSKATEKEMFAQAIMFMVYTPMVASKAARHPLKNILSQFSFDERDKAKEGIEAAIEIGLFVMDGADICLTQKGEGFMSFISVVINHPEKEDEARAIPYIAEILKAIEQDKRLEPPDSPAPPSNMNKRVNPKTQSDAIPGYTPLSIGNKIFLFIFGIVLLLGFMKLIFRY